MLLGSDSDPRPRVKVLDFGIAKMSQESEGSLRTETGAMIGTARFLTTLRTKVLTAEVNVVKVAIGYARMSTLKPAAEGLSLDTQRDRLRAYRQFNGITLIDITAWLGGIT